MPLCESCDHYITLDFGYNIRPSDWTVLRKNKEGAPCRCKPCQDALAEWQTARASKATYQRARDLADAFVLDGFFFKSPGCVRTVAVCQRCGVPIGEGIDIQKHFDDISDTADADGYEQDSDTVMELKTSPIALFEYNICVTEKAVRAHTERLATTEKAYNAALAEADRQKWLLEIDTRRVLQSKCDLQVAFSQRPKRTQ